jgi:hypothetical protein
MYEVFSFGKMPYGSNTSNSLAAKQIMAGIVPEKAQFCPTNLYENILLKAWSKVRIFYELIIIIFYFFFLNE